MKKLISAAFLGSICIEVCAQSSQGIVFGAGIRLCLPIGNFEEFTSFGVGAELQAEYSFSDMVSGVGTIGYTNFLGKDYGGGKTKATGYIPILAGARLYPVNRFFLGTQIGYGILTAGGNNEGYFNYQPQIGYNASAFQIALNYNSLSGKETTFNHFGLTGVFKF